MINQQNKWQIDHENNTYMHKLQMLAMKRK